MRDIREGIRRLLSDWRFTASTILILGLGIGINTALFSLVNAMLFREQPLRDPDRLVDIYQNGVNPGGVDANSYPAYLDIAAYTDVFATTTAVIVPHGVNYLDEGALRRAVVEHTTATYLSTLGLRPSLGRWFTEAEDTRGAAVVGVVSHRAWVRRFHADSSIIGRTISIEGVPVTIVGVGPAGHNGTINIGLVTDMWLPISSVLALGAPPRMLERRPEEAVVLVKARLRDGVTVAQAQAAMQALGRRLASDYPNEDPGKGISVFASRDVRVHPQMDALLAPAASALLAVVGLVLAIACTNVATLLLVRGTARAKEVSVRLALGATRSQIVRHLLTESLLLAAGGGAAGCLMAWWAIRSFGAIDLPVVMDLALDLRVLGFALALSLATGVAFGLAPALAATKVDLMTALRDGEPRVSGRRWLSLKNALVVCQVVVSVVLLGVTSLFVQLLNVSREQRVGFAVDGIAMLETDARYAGYAGADAMNVYEELGRRISAIPGVQSAVLTHGLPMQTAGTPIVADVVATASASAASGVSAATAGAIWAGPGFFDLLRIPILYGRGFDARDRADTPRVAVISESLARRQFGAVDAVGRRFRLEHDGASWASWIEVIGVARDTGRADMLGNLLDPTPQLFYRSFTQWDVAPTTVLARTSLDAATLAGAMQRELRGVNVTLPAISLMTMAKYLDDSLSGVESGATFLGVLGALGLCLAGMGLYAVVSFGVSRRSREIGIRMALGARSRQVVWAVAKDVAVLVAVGTGAGLTLSLLAIQALRLVTVSTPGISMYRPAVDPLALASIAAIMVVVAVAAACVPARRAATVDPMATLRRE